VRVGGDQIEFEVTSDERIGGLAAAEVRIPPGGGPPALHRHEAAEIYRIERGELSFYLADEAGEIRRSTVGQGETVAIAGGREHTVRNESGYEALAFAVYAPGARMEAFAHAAASLAEAGPPTPEGVGAVAAEHGIEITRPLDSVR